MPIDASAAYLDGKCSVVDAVRNATAEQLDSTVPATPLWTVTDVVRHVTGIAADLAAGTVPTDFNPIEDWQSDAGRDRGDAYTDHHVASRRDRRLDDVLAEWEQNTQRILPILRGEQPAPQPIPFIELIPVNDLAVHLHDIRGALQDPADRDTPLIALAFASYVAAFAMRLNARGLPAVRIRYGDGKERVTGAGEVAATWTGDRFDLFRALAGRRSNAQIAAMQWDGDPTPYLPLVSMYGVRADDLVE